MTTAEDGMDFMTAGTVVRLSDGALAIVVARIESAKFVLAGREGVQCVLARELFQAVAICAGCRTAYWWWATKDFRPRCFLCSPPVSEWYDATMEGADSFFRMARRSPHLDIEWARKILDAALVRGGRHWTPVQKLAFAPLVPVLLDEWRQQESAR